MTYITKYHGPTDYKGSRISVTDSTGRRTYHKYCFNLGGMFSSGPRHLFAANERALADGNTEPCAIFVELPNGTGYVWSTRNEVSE